MFSVIIPCYNREKFLRRTIESALAQIGAGDEIIFIDDGSTDRSLEIAQRYSDRISILTGPNRGVSEARNLGVRTANGDWLIFLDSDDLLPMGALEAYRKKLPHQKDIILIGNAQVIDEFDFIKNSKLYKRPKSTDSFGYLSHEIVSGWASNWSCCISKELFLGVGGYAPDISLGEDYDLNCRMIFSGAIFYAINENTYLIRVHDNDRLSKGLSQDRLDRFLKVFEYATSDPICVFGRPGGEASRIALGRWVWSMGRSATRAGHRDTAREYFSLATSFVGRSAWNASIALKICYYLIDPCNVEEISENIKNNIFSIQTEMKNLLNRLIFNFYNF